MKKSYILYDKSRRKYLQSLDGLTTTHKDQAYEFSSRQEASNFIKAYIQDNILYRMFYWKIVTLKP